MINPQDLIAKFRFALDNHWGYIWGKAGQIWTAAEQARATRPQTVQYGSKWIGQHVVDCSGLFYWAFRQLGGYIYHGSNSMFDKYLTAKGPLKNGKKGGSEALLPGTAVFTGDEANKGHVGLYCGNGVVIEAAGTQQGVITSKVTNKKWTYWGTLKGVEYHQEGGDQMPETIRPTLRKGDRGEYVTLLQTMLINRGYSCGSSGVDGIFGNATLTAVKSFQAQNDLFADGVVGPLTWDALDKVPDAPAVTYTIRISGLTKDETVQLLKVYPAADVSEERG